MIVFQSSLQIRKKPLPEPAFQTPISEPPAQDKTAVHKEPVVKLTPEQLFKKMNAGNLQSLPPASQYGGRQAAYVDQSASAFVRPDGPIRALFTSGAGPCVILMCVAKNENQEVVLAGMAHVDRGWLGGRTPEFFEDMKKRAGAGVHFEISLISGAAEQALFVFGQAQKFISDNPGSSFGFINCDLSGHRLDAALLSCEEGAAGIFYGPLSGQVELKDAKELNQAPKGAKSKSRAKP